MIIIRGHRKSLRKKPVPGGIAVIDFSTFFEIRLFFVCASVDYEKEDFGKRTFGDMKIIHVKPDAEFNLERFLKGRENIILDSFEYEKPYEAGSDFDA